MQKEDLRHTKNSKIHEENHTIVVRLNINVLTFWSKNINRKNTFIYFFSFFRAAPVTYRNSQAMGRIAAAVAGLCHSHSNAESKLHFQPTPQLMGTLDP